VSSLRWILKKEKKRDIEINIKLIMQRLPFQILVFPYRFLNAGEKIEFALFKREAPEGWVFWQGIAGGGEGNETPLETAKRETYEESGIPMESNFIKLNTVNSIPITGFKEKHLWEENLYVIPEYSFGVNVSNSIITISKEHTKYKWLRYSEAMKILKWDSNKTALWELNCRLLNIDPRDVEEILVNLLDEIKEIIRTQDTDVLWSSFDTKEDFLKELDNHIQRFQNNDFSSIEKLIGLFLPTGDLQEIAISSGWGEEYLAISKKFDDLIQVIF
jgi:dATP pyrophosphohydrolase